MDGYCELCNSPLTGKQYRFCSKLCRNIVAGRASSIRLKPCDKEWLLGEYLLPPEGKGRTQKDISKEIGVSEVTLRKWINQYGLSQNQNKRIAYFQKRPCLNRRKTLPPKDELANLYLMPPEGAGMSQDEISKNYGVSRLTLVKWLNEYELSQKHSIRHSIRMTGENNPAWKNGTARNFQIKILVKIKPKECDWCGTTKKVQMHHINHNKEDCDKDNLTWLCNHCNVIESRLNALQKDGRVAIEMNNNKLIINFVGNTHKE